MKRKNNNFIHIIFAIILVSIFTFLGCELNTKIDGGVSINVNSNKEISEDKSYYGENGGVTFSGGEPMMYPQVINELISLCKKEGINAGYNPSPFTAMDNEKLMPLKKELKELKAKLEIEDIDLLKAVD